MSAGASGHQFAKLVGESASRLRFSRVRGVALTGCYAASGALALWCAAALAGEWPRHFALPFAAAVVAIFAIVCATAWLLPVSEPAAWRALDRERGLPDSAVSTAELGPLARPEWHERMLDDTLARASMARPAPGRRFSWPAVFGVTSMAVLCAVLVSIGLTARGDMVRADDSVAAEQRKELAELFKDWDEAQEKFPDPQLEQLLQEVKPLREKIAAGQLDKRETLLELSKLEDRLAAMQEEQEKASLDPHAAGLADALAGIEEMKQLASSLREKDYEKARKAADKLDKELSRQGASVPSGARSQSAQQRMQDAGQKMEQAGQKSMADAMRDMAQGAKNNDASQMARGAAQMAQAMAQQQARQQQGRGRGLQRQQIAAAKESLGQEEGTGMGMSLVPRLSLQKSKEPGKGAGSETDPNRFGEKTDSLGATDRQELTGQANQSGETEVTTERTSEATRERTRDAAAADFAQYRKLSEEAIEDESLPMARRMTIRRYFESIRPASDEQPANESR